MTDILEQIRTRQVKTDAMVARLRGLRGNARRLPPDWSSCINVTMSETELAENWDVVLDMLAGKLIHENRPALEMAVASPEPGYKVVWVRTG